MSGLFSTLNIGRKGMNAQQTALHTTAHNITNSNTERYSRQRVEMKSDYPHTMHGVGQIGTGVRMETIIRAVDDLVSKQIRDEGGSLSQYGSKSEVLGQIEVIYNEPSDTGLNFSIGEVFSSWQELAKNPENISSKAILVEKSEAFSDTFNHIRNQLDSVNNDIDSMVAKDVVDLNAKLKNLDSLNNQIFSIAIKGYVPNDLLDQRDKLLREVSDIVDFDIEIDQWERVSLKNDKISLLDAGKDGLYEISENNGILEVNGEEINLRKGSIKGFLEAKVELEQQIDDFDNFGESFANAINQGHTTNDEGNPVDGAIPFFVYDPASKKLEVNSELINNNSLVLTGKTYDSAPGDGSRALKIAKIKDLEISFGGNISTIENRYNSMITDVGISKEHADNMVTNQNVVLRQLDMRRESTSGVSIDEEVTDLIKYQKAFEANARVIATLTEMLDVLINRTGV